ncbi:MAG: acylneuraminate cytidylyltransferase family protein [Thermodesulfobacteriota bacterium]
MIAKNTPTALGVIPARGGSKRLPRKNIKLLAGKPLLAYTIEAARLARSLTYFLVSTEDPEILEVAREYGAPTPFVRPRELAGDEVRNIETVHHALTFLREEKGLTFDVLVLLQPTCPIRNPAHIDEAVNKLWASDLDSAVSVKGPFKKRDPILKAVRGGVLEDYQPVGDPAAVEPFYLYNASIYAVKTDYFLRHRRLISPRQVPIVMDQFHSIDVDTEADFLVAEVYLDYLRSGADKEDKA